MTDPSSAPAPVPPSRPTSPAAASGLTPGAADGDWIALQPEPIDVPAAVRFVADPRVGGIDVFLGTTRAERNAAGRELLALDYEAYPEMAVARMRRLAADARGRWPVVKLALLHRVGRVPVAEPSVVIAVACPHRGEAFDACRWLIDALKVDVPVWKREVWADGSATWVHP
jgi:molybdopterin synthase catalytic subunit